MNKTELISAVAEKSGLTKKDVEKAISATLDTIKEEVAKGEKVQVIGFGTFEARQRNARTGQNPQTKQTVEIPAATVPAFKAGKAFKDIVNAK
jgi:DNA-binding protein HU-beta